MFATRGRRISPAPRLHGVRLESEGEGGGGAVRHAHAARTGVKAKEALTAEAAD
jgi:hypothetical protein